MADEVNFRIGTVEDEITTQNPHKFIVVLDGKDFVYHSKSSNHDSRIHGDIARILRINEGLVLGGGSAEFPHFSGPEDTMRIYGGSTHFGAVPEEILRKFPQEELLRAYRKINHKIQKIQFQIFGDSNPYWERLLRI